MDDREKVARRQWLQQGLTGAHREVDTILVSVSAGVVALSVAFVEGIETPVALGLIKASWVFFVATICCVLASLLCEQADKRKRIGQVDNDEVETDGSLDTAIDWLNKSGIGLFTVGLGLLLWFLWLNTN